ncbi:MAG: DegT/DnrJ/EryC1/StrS family aminotransferase [bacterium]
MADFIPITKPYFTQQDKEMVQKPLESGWVVQGEQVEEFENTFASFCDAGYGVATSSCTSALHLAMRCMEPEPGDEVIVPGFTWITTANVVEYENATPVFCDINLDTFNLRVDSLGNVITEDTVGIIPVHLFGLSADMDPILEMASAHDLWVVEDAACGLGAVYDDQHVGTFGEAGCFSFHPRKSITTGEGGMVVTDQPDIDRNCRSLRDHGATRTDRERHEGEGGSLLPEYPKLGYNYRMTDIQAAVGNAQMEHIDYILKERRKQAGIYNDLLSDVEWLKTPTVPEGYEHGYQSYVTLFCPEEPSINNVERLHQSRNNVMEELENNNIATRPGTHAAVFQEYYRNRYDYTKHQLPNSYLAQQLTLTLPMYVGLEPSDQERVVGALKGSVSEGI